MRCRIFSSIPDPMVVKIPNTSALTISADHRPFSQRSCCLSATGDRTNDFLEMRVSVMMRVRVRVRMIASTSL